MSEFTVNTTPQGIFPDGLNDAVAITNNGPWTVYLDSGSSVNTSSYPLPPTATIVWDAQRPLWAVSAGDSSVISLTMNSDAGNSDRAAVYSLIANSVNVTLDSGGAQTTLNESFECSSYQTLVLDLTTDMVASTTMTASMYHAIYVKWYTASGLFVSADEYDVPAFLTATGRIIVSIKGDRCEVTARQVGAISDVVMASAVYGTSRVLRPEMDWMRNFNGASISAYCPGPAFSVEDHSFRHSIYRGWLNVGNNIQLNNLGRKVVIRVLNPTTITTAGFLELRDFLTGTPLERLTIPTGGVGTHSATWVVPASRPMDIRNTAVTSGSTFHISVCWEDD